MGHVCYHADSMLAMLFGGSKISNNLKWSAYVQVTCLRHLQSVSLSVLVPAAAEDQKLWHRPVTSSHMLSGAALPGAKRARALARL